MCALYKLTICLLMFVKSFIDRRHLGRTLQRNVVPLERPSEEEETMLREIPFSLIARM